MANHNNDDEIIRWVAENMGDMPKEDQFYCMFVTAQFANALRPVYEKHNKAETKGFTILGRLN